MKFTDFYGTSDIEALKLPICINKGFSWLKDAIENKIILVEINNDKIVSIIRCSDQKTIGEGCWVANQQGSIWLLTDDKLHDMFKPKYVENPSPYVDLTDAIKSHTDVQDIDANITLVELSENSLLTDDVVLDDVVLDDTSNNVIEPRLHRKRSFRLKKTTEDLISV